MRLKHMVKDKINYRARGPNTFLTRQAVQGRANDGGLRIGEMERDGVLAHGMSYFLNESFLIRGDEYFMAVCNKTGAIAIYNEDRNLFLSPYADGPVQFHTNPDGSLNIKNISRFGRSFSLLRIPYTFKLLIHELQCMNIQMRIITDKNIDNLLGMSYSDNINKLLQSTKPVKELIGDYLANMKNKMNIEKKINGLVNEVPVLPNQNDLNTVDGELTSESMNEDYDTYKPNSPQYAALPDSPNEMNPVDNLVREVEPNGVINVRMEFESPYLNSMFSIMTTEERRQLMSKPRDEQVRILMKMYKKKFNSYNSTVQEGVLSKLRYNNSEYDIYGLLDYLTNGINDDSTEESIPEQVITEQIFDKPLIKKPAIEETSILDVESEPEAVVEESSKEENNSGDAKKVSFDLSSTPESSDSSNTTRKITL
jgi:hypothetical protein